MRACREQRQAIPVESPLTNCLSTSRYVSEARQTPREQPTDLRVLPQQPGSKLSRWLTKSWEIINVCCCKPLSFEVVCDTAKPNWYIPQSLEVLVNKFMFSCYYPSYSQRSRWDMEDLSIMFCVVSMIKALLEFLKGKGHNLIFPAGLIHCFIHKRCSVRDITFLKRNKSLVLRRL